LSARHLSEFVTDWAGYEQRTNNRDLPSKHGGCPHRRAVLFFLKLSLCRVADLVERANQLAHDGALCRTDAPLPIGAYERAARELLSEAEATMVALPTAPVVAAPTRATHLPVALPPLTAGPPPVFLPTKKRAYTVRAEAPQVVGEIRSELDELGLTVLGSHGQEPGARSSRRLL